MNIIIQIKERSIEREFKKFLSVKNDLVISVVNNWHNNIQNFHKCAIFSNIGKYQKLISTGFEHFRQQYSFCKHTERNLNPKT